jgi:Tetracyclin repressor-like, C-terminal domain
MKAAEGLPRLRSAFERWLGWTEKAGLGGGCPVTAGFFEFDDAAEDDPVRRRRVAMEARTTRLRLRVRLQPQIVRALILGSVLLP